LAAVNYHFGSKEELFQAVLTRRLDPMNQERVQLLTRLEAKAAPAPLSCDRILMALFVPALRLARDPARGGKDFLRLLGRAYADPAPFIRQFLSEQYAPMIARFKAAFGRALPHLSRRELSWRLHFIMGALSYTLAGTDALKLIAELNPRDTTNDELLLRRLAPFLLAGLTAPLPDLTDVTRELDGELARRA
jgi:AcrR family transcriptional regulator